MQESDGRGISLQVSIGKNCKFAMQELPICNFSEVPDKIGISG